MEKKKGDYVWERKQWVITVWVERIISFHEGDCGYKHYIHINFVETNEIQD